MRLYRIEAYEQGDDGEWYPIYHYRGMASDLPWAMAASLLHAREIKDQEGGWNSGSSVGFDFHQGSPDDVWNSSSKARLCDCPPDTRGDACNGNCHEGGP